MISRFAKWFRGLSSTQVFVVYGFLAVFALLTLWHNPTEGYRRTGTAIKASTAEEAIHNMKIRPDLNNWELYHWWLKQPVIQPKSGYFYMDESPWWWVYSYNSRGFDEDTIPRFIRAPLTSLKTFGGYLHTVIIFGIMTSVLIWLTGLRRSDSK